jgi:hypothetical protein
MPIEEQLPPGVVDVALRVGEALERCGAPYFVGGSLASSLDGEPRATNDIDIVMDLSADQVGAFAVALGSDFAVDEDSLVQAIKTRQSWNIYYLPWVIKVDLFPRRTGGFDDAEFSRRRKLELVPGRKLWVKSPEDSVLRKLRWYRDGGEVSGQQWRDVEELMRINARTLDHEYLKSWATSLGVGDLLERLYALNP